MSTSTFIAGPMPKIGARSWRKSLSPRQLGHIGRFLITKLLRRWLKPSAFATSAW